MPRLTLITTHHEPIPGLLPTPLDSLALAPSYARGARRPRGFAVEQATDRRRDAVNVRLVLDILAQHARNTPALRSARRLLQDGRSPRGQTIPIAEIPGGSVQSNRMHRAATSRTVPTADSTMHTILFNLPRNWCFLSNWAPDILVILKKLHRTLAFPTGRVVLHDVGLDADSRQVPRAGWQTRQT